MEMHKTHVNMASLLTASTRNMLCELQELQSANLKRGHGILAQHFWLRGGASLSHTPKAASERELHRHTEQARLGYAKDAKTFPKHMEDLQQLLHEESLKIGTHREAAVLPDAPSRCGKSGDFELTELQRAAQKFFEPNCPPPMRRIMVELTPGMGKTCVYMEVISKFLGKRDMESGEFFDIVVLGDDEVFSAFGNLDKCPARVNVEEIVKYNVKVLEKNHMPVSLVDRTVLYTKSGGDIPNKKIISIKSLNKGKDPTCALNTSIMSRDIAPASSFYSERSPSPFSSGKGHGKGKAAGSHCPTTPSVKSSPGKSPAETLSAFEGQYKEKTKKKEDNLSGFAKSVLDLKSPCKCGADALVWRGSRVIFMPYALAARLMIYTRRGVSVENMTSEGGDIRFASGETQNFLKKDLGQLFAKQQKATAASGKDYGIQNFDPDGSNTLYIIDEVQNLATPSEWKHPFAKSESPALSEALWRNTGDFSEAGLKKTPYIFAGTATPNTGTNPESTVCLLQILNGKQRPHLFIPRWESDEEKATRIGRGESASYENMPPHKGTYLDRIKKFRAFLEVPSNLSKTLYWPPHKERHPDNLVVFPRMFLEEKAGFVKEMTHGSQHEAFPLMVVKKKSHGRVMEWDFNKDDRYSYADAVNDVIQQRLLPRDPGKQGAEAYLEHRLEKDSKKTLMNEVAYKSFICAARSEDLQYQYSRIYKPVYSDLNRLFLQDVVSSRVFTANSYFDYRVYPQVDPTELAADLALPLTRLVSPSLLLRCIPRKKIKGRDPGSSPPPEGFNPKTDDYPRIWAEKFYPAAAVRVRAGGSFLQAAQYPWFVPPGAAEKYVKELKANVSSPPKEFSKCRWGEWSLCSKLSEIPKLCEDLFKAYKEDRHSVDLALENRLRDVVANYCPKLVAAADDMYAFPPPESKAFPAERNIFAPGLAAESKSFFFLNAENHVGPGGFKSNYFIFLASFYFRMRCRPYLQKLFEGNEKYLPPEYQGGGEGDEEKRRPTLQHRIAWLDALLLEGGRYDWLEARALAENTHARRQSSASREKGEPLDLDKISFPDWSENSRIASRNENLYPPHNLKEAPPNSVPSVSGWSAFWKTWLKGYGINRSFIASKRISETLQRHRAALSRSVQKHPSPPLKTKKSEVASSPTAFEKAQKELEKNIRGKKKAVKKEEAADYRDEEKLKKLKEDVPQKSFFLKAKTFYKKQKKAKERFLLESFYVPAIFAVGDTTMDGCGDVKRTNLLHHKLYCLFMRKLERDHVLSKPQFRELHAPLTSQEEYPRAWEDRLFYERGAEHEKCQSEEDLTLADVLDLLGSPGLREAMVKGGMALEPCVLSKRGHEEGMILSPKISHPRESPAGQSMVFAGLSAHKALDFKCTGLNVAFGPQPRGQRIQEMGRNWRTCVEIPYISIRQLFLDGEDQVLKNDILLDSFYLAQNEIIDWFRIITISAGLGCSLWWGYSNWAKLLSSYRAFRKNETDWFFGTSSPCLDSKNGPKASLKEWAAQEGSAEHEHFGFWRCARTIVTSRAFLDEKKDVGRIVHSPAGAFFPDEIVFDTSSPGSSALPADPSCRMGSAVDVNENIHSASTKYCLSLSESLRAEAETKSLLNSTKGPVLGVGNVYDSSTPGSSADAYHPTLPLSRHRSPTETSPHARSEPPHHHRARSKSPDHHGLSGSPQHHHGRSDSLHGSPSSDLPPSNGSRFPGSLLPPHLLGSLDSIPHTRPLGSLGSIRPMGPLGSLGSLRPASPLGSLGSVRPTSHPLGSLGSLDSFDRLSPLSPPSSESNTTDTETARRVHSPKASPLIHHLFELSQNSEGRPEEISKAVKKIQEDIGRL